MSKKITADVALTTLFSNAMRPKNSEKPPRKDTKAFRVLMEWVAMLRSGEFVQGERWLKAWDKKGVIRHCCLGVLCEKYAVEIGGFWDVKGIDGQSFVADYDRTGYAISGESLPTDPVTKWAKLPPFAVADLSNLNDSGEFTFAMIADVIEAWLTHQKTVRLTLGVNSRYLRWSR